MLVFPLCPAPWKKQVAPAARPTPCPQKVEFLDRSVDFHLRSAARIFILARFYRDIFIWWEEFQKSDVESI